MRRSAPGSELFPKIGFDTLSERSAENYVDDRVDRDGRPMHLDLPRSVSGLELERDWLVWPSDKELLEQCERFHNGS